MYIWFRLQLLDDIISTISTGDKHFHEPFDRFSGHAKKTGVRLTTFTHFPRTKQSAHKSPAENTPCRSHPVAFIGCNNHN